MTRIRIVAVRWLALCIVVCCVAQAAARERWTVEQAQAWYARQPWLVGANFTPSTAINQLEMWQADSFDPDAIDRELGWAADLGFNSMRVFLHNLLWEEDRDALVDRIKTFLAIADRHGIRIVFVPFDGVWDPNPRLGPQRAPRAGVHNSGWVQAPGADVLGDPARHDSLRPYIVGLVSEFRDDKRIVAWDLFNEPDNANVKSYGAEGTGAELNNKAEMAAALLRKTFAWAREADPSQPLTSGVWLGPWPADDKLSPIERLMIDESDIVSFHNYGGLPDVRLRVEQLQRYGRPILCTEFMARPAGSRFDPLLEYFREQKVGAYCWGLVSGKSQTIYPWDSWQRPYDGEPDVWFHDVFRADGAAYDEREAAYIRRVTGGKSGSAE